MTRKHEVIVIGGGFTGLSCATALMEAGVDVVLIEARDRVGGRVESQVLPDGRRIDSGGQFLCDDMPDVMALVRRYGKTLVRSHADGELTFQPDPAPERGYQVLEEVETLRQAAAEADLDDPLTATLSVRQWLARQDVSDAARRSFGGLTEGLWCRSPDDVLFRYLASTERRFTNTQSELEYFLGETMHSLAEDLARGLGARLRLNCAADRIGLRDDGVTVHCGSTVFKVDTVVVALPPVMTARLAYEPPLGGDLTEALDAWASGTVIKVLLSYRTTFWRDRGLSGTVMWSEPAGLYVCDVSPDDKRPMLCAFVGGSLARDWHGKPLAELQDFVCGLLARAIGGAAGEPTGFFARDWTDDPWSGGGYSDVIVRPVARDPEATLRAGLPRLHFACSELSTSFPGYIEGAIVAGKAAARDIAAQRAAGGKPTQPDLTI
jgi:monoamine oxidase